MRMRWTTQSIVKALRARKRRGEAVSWRGLATADRALLSAATYHFGSLKAALSAAGIDYDDVAKRPRRTKDRIIQTLKAARRKGKDLSWGAATQAKRTVAPRGVRGGSTVQKLGSRVRGGRR